MGGKVDGGMVGLKAIIVLFGGIDGSEVVGNVDGQTAGFEVVNEVIGRLVGAVVGSEVSFVSVSREMLPDWLQHTLKLTWWSSSVGMKSSGDGGSSGREMLSGWLRHTAKLTW